ncbi:MAG TPA: hypothetical protein VMS94_03840 [Acidobacteriota bacterium]|jgi:hypothetical protein|nr:hypothetical protein [Acidobacteriota bacterium]
MSGLRHHPLLIYAIGASALGLLTVVLLAASPPIIHETLSWRKPLVGSVFILICTFGIFAALFPKRCSQTFHFNRENMKLAPSRIRATSHHPDCGRFSAHVIYVNGHTLCAACTGLLWGGIIAITGSLIYFFVGWQIQAPAFATVFIGTAAIVLGFFQLAFRGFLRSALNTLFVLGAFLILVGIDESIGSLFVDFFIEAYIVFWIFTRIQLSQWDHSKICSNCESPCEIGETKKNWG